MTATPNINLLVPDNHAHFRSPTAFGKNIAAQKERRNTQQALEAEFKMFEFDLFSLALPLAYIIVLIGSLVTFSSIYRKRKAGMAPYLSSP